MFKKFFTGAKNSVTSFLDDNCMAIAGAIAYYILQGLLPLIIGVVVVATFFLQKGTQARADFIDAVKGLVPSNAGIEITDIIDSLLNSAPGLLSITAVVLLWSGSGIFGQLIFGVNMAFGVRKDRRNFFVQTGLRLLMLLIFVGLVGGAYAITILFQIVVSAKVELFGVTPQNFSFILPVVSYLTPILMVFLAFSVLYWIAPNVKEHKFKHAAVGGLVSALLFELLKYGFTYYVSAFNAADSYQRSYGALGGVLLFLFYLYISSAIILFGAEVAAVAGGFKPASENKPAKAATPAEIAEEIKIERTFTKTENAQKSNGVAVAIGSVALLMAGLAGWATRRRDS